MKHIVIALLACLPMMGMAQNTWEAPQNEARTTQVKAKKKALFESKKQKEDPKYLAGAVPEVNGRVVFTFDKAVPGMSADEIYRRVYDCLEGITKEENQLEGSKIAAINKSEHTIAARLKEWLVFKNSFLSLDRTVFNYTIIARATDGHVTVTMERLSYQYEQDRTDVGGGMDIKAEDWITDREALSKNKEKLAKLSAKFRRKTIDRKDNIFGRLSKALAL